MNRGDHVVTKLRALSHWAFGQYKCNVTRSNQKLKFILKYVIVTICVKWGG